MAKQVFNARKNEEVQTLMGSNKKKLGCNGVTVVIISITTFHSPKASRSACVCAQASASQASVSQASISHDSVSQAS